MTPKRPSISVLIPTYNRASFLPTTLASVLEQTLPPDEVILIDDGSTDDTPTVVDSLVARRQAWANRLRYIRQDNQGKSRALNAGLPLARGEWIAFNDSDDTWALNKLESQFEALARFPECLASFTETTLSEFTDRHPELTAQARGSFGKVDNPSHLYPIGWPGTYMQSLVVRADVMQKCGEVDPLYRLSHDVDLLFRLGLITPFCYVALPLVVINREPSRTLGIMTSYPARSWISMLETESMLCKWLSIVDESQQTLRRILKHELASARSALANRYILSGNLRDTRRVLRNAVRDAPEVRLLVKWMLACAAPALLHKLAGRRAPAEFFTPDGPPHAL